MRINKNTNGFTLVEILIVVIILGILAAIIIPQFSNASQDAKESSLTSGLQTLRSQCELYKVQHSDNYPWDQAAAFADIAGIMESKTDVTGLAAGNFGPYFPTTPENPFATGALFVDEDTADGTNHWIITTLGTILPDAQKPE
ncbi:MAG: prepilin-type N-terminal cleavage/methylation domain-containing protein [Phycisphaerae bacterium]|nr:prepilin-type N-terminal cleavage/methylation domain-containing protein [Phycisphaerae bacterium]